MEGERLGVPTQHPRRRHPEHPGERRQAEEDRDPHPESEAAEEGHRLEGADQLSRDEVGEEARQDHLDGDAQGHAHEAPQEPEEGGLAEVEGEDLARPDTQALEDRHRVQAGGEPGADALRHPDPAHEEREQGDEA